MRRPVHRRLPVLGGLLLLAVLLGTVLTAGHHHDEVGPGRAPCAVCVTASHSPALLSAPAVAGPATELVERLVLRRSVPVGTETPAPVRGRAPPSPAHRVA